MSKLTVFVIEDDFIHANRLEMYLDEMGYHFAGHATSASEALNKIAAIKPDLLLVDIHLKGNRDGIDIMETINAKQPIPAIFITSYRDKDTFNRAKITNPYAYIVKPYDKDSLQMAIELAVYKFSQHSKKTPTTAAVFQTWEEDQVVQNTVFIKSGKKLIKINTEEILYIEAQDKRCLIGGNQGEIAVRISLQKLEQQLIKNTFQRVHRSFIINLSKITQVDPSNNKVYIQQKELPIGRAYRDALLSVINP